MEKATKKKIKNETFQPLSRGLRKHLGDMTGNQVKFYVYCLTRVIPFGDDKGSFSDSSENIWSELKWNNKLFYKTLKELDGKYIKFTLSKSRWGATTIKVLKYKNVEDFYDSEKRQSNGYGKGGYDSEKRQSNGYGKSYKSKNDKGLQASNNIKNTDNNKNTKSHSPESGNSGDSEKQKPKKSSKKKAPEDISLQTKIVDLYWEIAERYTGKKPVWQRQGAKNYPLMFRGLADLKQTIQAYRDVFTNGFEDKWHYNKMSPSWALENFNVLLNLKNKRKPPSQQIAKSGALSEKLKQRTERKYNAEQERGCGESDKDGKGSDSGNNGVSSKEQAPCEYEPGSNLF